MATNDYRGGKLAGYKLFDLGGKNFSYIGVTRSLNINKERLNGFLKALQIMMLRFLKVISSLMISANLRAHLWKS